ncbi:hypothetical protein FHW69_002864 [Luteibacter sp. Sphag1AF]|uniref:hypothetical protein n=1 Tax=Luteibacter sp. Sphag1AF TaxID=2587031 RepID=UPI0016225ECA|nr:hypothetical protein [Luteibacter sp. Sphag1AF]MBB3228229.1 hypothetical protein [Luteibacter sp. Sphag1AF]
MRNDRASHDQRDAVTFPANSRPDVLIGDRAYDSEDLDDGLRGKVIKLMSPHRKNRKKPKAQDGR